MLRMKYPGGYNTGGRKTFPEAAAAGRGVAIQSLLTAIVDKAETTQTAEMSGEEIVATLEWAAGALLRTALQDFEGQR
jgi:hypothetical protein